MTIVLSPLQKGKELIAQLDSDLKELAADMRSHAGQIRVDTLWEIPQREAALVDSRHRIEIVAPEGIGAVSLVIESLTSLWLRPKQHIRETLRSPGAVALPDRFIERIRETSRQRIELYELLQPLKQAERLKVWRTQYGISALQTLRIATVLHDPLSLRFYWDTSPSMKRISAGDLIQQYEDMLKETHGNLVPTWQSLPETSVDRKFAYSVEHLRQLDSHEPVAVYRHGKPHVRVRIKDGDAKPYIATCALPLVYSINCKPPAIKPLHDYEPPKLLISRSVRAKVEPQPFIESLNIYRFLPQFRVPLKGDSDSDSKPERYARKKEELTVTTKH